MPNQSHSGMLGIPWFRCQMCGKDFRTSELRWQNGLLVCMTDWDNPIAWNRPILIQEVLQESPQEMEVAEVLKGNDRNPEPSLI